MNGAGQGGAGRRTVWPEGSTRPIGIPIQPSVVYRTESPDALDDLYEGRVPGFSYAREGHPNAAYLAGRIDGLEGAAGGLVVGSGMAAVSAAVLGLLSVGDHVLGGCQLYGRSLRLLTDDLPRLGMASGFADPTSVAAVEAALRPETRMILIEVTSNPTLRIADLDRIAALARDRGTLLAVDNTFTTSRAIRPFEHGADIVIHSVTKLLAGHSDATLSYVAARDPDLQARISAFATTLGLTASPSDCWLTDRGLHSFELRYDRAEANAAALADAIADMAGVTGLIYPGRADHPDRARAESLLRGRNGSMVTFHVTGDRAAANALVRAGENLAFAPTLGDIGTTLSHPATSSHRALSADGRARLGLHEGPFRISVCVEPIELLIAEFEAAIGAARRAG